MKAVINEKETPVKYPCLMIASKTTNIIVLMSKYGIGAVVGNENSDHYIGFLKDSWNMEVFTPFTGSITLSND